MRRYVLSLAAALTAALALATPAAAAPQPLTYRYGPIELDSFRTVRPKVIVRAPNVDGYLTEMHARLVDAKGNPLDIGRVMLHHVVMINGGRFTGDRAAKCGTRWGEPFYGTGEENQTLSLPAGYGYRLRRGDRWKMQTMLMNHSPSPQKVWVEYSMKIDTARLRPVVPFWLRVTHCRNEPSYSIAGGMPPGAVHRRTSTWTVPFDGHIVAAGAHLHGGAHDLVVNEPACGDRRLLHSDPSYGLPDNRVYNVQPQLHEPGPINTSWFLSSEGVPVHKGEQLSLTALYDGEHPHVGVMGVMHVYVAPGKVPPEPCAPLPGDAQELRALAAVRDEPPFVKVALTKLVGDVPTPIEHPEGMRWSWPWATQSPIVRVTAGRFTKVNLDVAQGTTITWKFEDREPHKIALANGPRAVGSPTFGAGKTWSRKFSAPGTYQLFCPLHPMTMHQEIDVRPATG